MSLILEFVFQLEEAIFDLLLKRDRQQNISTHQFWVQGMLAYTYCRAHRSLKGILYGRRCDCVSVRLYEFNLLALQLFKWLARLSKDHLG